MEHKQLKREQQEVLSLLKEIDKLCRKNKIDYYLSPQLTLCGVTGQPFPQDPLAGVVLMKVPDMERFRQAFETAQPHRRALESMKNNKRFPGFYLRYENLDTLCFNLDEGRNFRSPGLGINIVPLRGIISSRKRHLWSRALEIGWRETCDGNSRKPGLKNLLCKIPVRLASLVGRARLGRHLYDKFQKGQAGTDAQEYVLRLDKDTTYYYPAEIFEKTSRMLLEGEKFMVPDQKVWYLQKTYGANYEEVLAEEYKPNPAVMASALVSWEDFFEETGSLKKLIRARRKQYLKDSIGRRRQRYYNWCWNYAKLCASRRNLNAYYEEKKDYIRNLYKNGDYMRLEAIFRPYTRVMQRCLKEKDVYVADDEIIEIYMNVIEKTGNQELKAQIDKCW